VLPAPNRLTKPAEFRTTVRNGVRVGRATLVVHAVRSDLPPTRVGFVVSKAVGNAVTRNRVKRRLRHLAQHWVPVTPMPVHVVVRALPGAASRPGDLPNDFATAWSEALSRLGVAR
jgi:ribonuclease P protein component